jgi:hypothetical protein
MVKNDRWLRSVAGDGGAMLAIGESRITENAGSQNCVSVTPDASYLRQRTSPRIPRPLKVV